MTEIVQTGNELHSNALGQGTDFSGVADLTDATGAIIEQGGTALAAYPRAVALGITLIHRIVDRLSSAPEMAAHLAGFGWIGKCCLLIAPEIGPRVRWVTVLTDAPLTPSGTSIASRCGDCLVCVDVCPANAFTDEAFRPEDAREVRFDASKCNEYLQAMKETTGHRICGLCLKECPYGKRVDR
ncbi:MAG: epoxyqueuosine reductase [Spirochaetales bacterium]|jgi:ferredoxin|nr:epoxyqueuosine reductase [Spirochaetales bacterium]